MLQSNTGYLLSFTRSSKKKIKDIIEENEKGIEDILESEPCDT